MSKLKTIKLQGKDYAQVKERIKKFREETTNGSIETEMQQLQDGSVVVKAIVITDLSKEDSKRATGQAFGKVTGAKAFEKLETIAVGRALAFLGYLADGEIASSEEMEEFIEYQEQKKENAKERLNGCKTIDELKEAFTSLGSLMGDKDIISLKDEIKAKLQ